MQREEKVQLNAQREAKNQKLDGKGGCLGSLIAFKTAINLGSYPNQSIR